jgi:hypothetical protein
MKISALVSSPLFMGNHYVNSGTRTSFSLNSAYVNNTSGFGVGVRYHAKTTDTLDEFYVMLDANTGTLGNITMQCIINNENGATRAGSTTRATSTATAMPNAVDKWIKFTFGTPYTPAIGEILWFIAYNTSAAPTTDYPQILTVTTAQYNNIISAYGVTNAYSTTNGFSAGGSAISETPFVIKQGSMYVGNPFTAYQATTTGSNTLERGIQITLTSPVTISGVMIYAGASNINELKIYDSTTAPGGTTIATIDLDSTANMTTGDTSGGFSFSPITLPAGTYNIVLSISANSTLPASGVIEDYSSYSTMFDSMRAQDTLHNPIGVVDDGAGGWTLLKDLCPGILLYIDDFPYARYPAAFFA